MIETRFPFWAKNHYYSQCTYILTNIFWRSKIKISFAAAADNKIKLFKVMNRYDLTWNISIKDISISKRKLFGNYPIFEMNYSKIAFKWKESASEQIFCHCSFDSFTSFRQKKDECTNITNVMSHLDAKCAEKYWRREKSCNLYIIIVYVYTRVCCRCLCRLSMQPEQDRNVK